MKSSSTRRRALMAALIMLAAAIRVAAEEAPPPPLTIGDPAPALEVEAFLKGEPITQFAPGHAYVVEFWATWCKPCIYGMPHLTGLQAKWADRLTVIGVDVWESGKDTPYTDATRARVAAFVAEKDTVIGYHIAYDGAAQKAATNWLRAAGLTSIPSAFLVDGAGRIAHIGNPAQSSFEMAVAAVIDGSHDLVAARVAYEAERERAKTEATARRVATQRLNGAVSAALPLITAGQWSAGVAALDTLDGVFAALGPSARDQAKVQACRELYTAGQVTIADAFVDHLLAADAMASGLELNEIAWLMVNPDAPVAGADPRRAVRCAERALMLLEPEVQMFRTIIMEVQARGLWLAGERDRAVAVLTEAVRVEPNEKFRAGLQALLADYTR